MVYRSHHWGASQVALGPVLPEPHHYSQFHGCSPHFHCSPPQTQSRLEKKKARRRYLYSVVWKTLDHHHVPTCTHQDGTECLLNGTVLPEPHHDSQFHGCSPHFHCPPPQTQSRQEKKTMVYRSHHWGAPQVALGPALPEPHHDSHFHGCSPHFHFPPPRTQVRLEKKISRLRLPC